MIEQKKIKELEDLIRRVKLIREEHQGKAYGECMMAPKDSFFLVECVKELIVDRKTFLSIHEIYEEVFNELLDRMEKNKDLIKTVMDETNSNLFYEN